MATCFRRNFKEIKDITLDRVAINRNAAKPLGRYRQAADSAAG